MHAQLGTSLPACLRVSMPGILRLATSIRKPKTRFLWSLAYLDYGSITETDDTAGKQL